MAITLTPEEDAALGIWLKTAAFGLGAEGKKRDETEAQALVGDAIAELLASGIDRAKAPKSDKTCGTSDLSR